MSQLTRAEFQLQAFMVDNDAGEGAWTVAEIDLVKSRLLHLAPVAQAAPLSTYVWTLDDATIIGLPDIDHRQAAKVFAVALSVQAWRFFHSPVIVSTVSALRISPKGLFGSVTTKLTSPRVTVEESSFVEAATALKTVWAMSGTRGKIIQEALNSYWDALHSVHRRSRFLSLWAAFERAVNDDGGDRRGTRFDNYAASITSFGCGDIKPLRELNNWLKHANQVREHEAEIAANIGVSSRTLKRLVDQSLASRLGFSLSATYDQ